MIPQLKLEERRLLRSADLFDNLCERGNYILSLKISVVTRINLLQSMLLGAADVLESLDVQRPLLQLVGARERNAERPTSWSSLDSSDLICFRARSALLSLCERANEIAHSETQEHVRVQELTIALHEAVEALDKLLEVVEVSNDYL